MKKTIIMSLAIVGSLVIQAYPLAAVLAFVLAVGRAMERNLADPAKKPLRNPAAAPPEGFPG